MRILWKLMILGAVLLAVIVATIVVFVKARPDRGYLGYYASNSILGKYSTVAISVDATPCAEIGKLILQKNGSAVDAAISVLLCMGVVIPQSMGLGGGSFMTIYNSTTKESEVIDSREVAPIDADENMFSSDSDAAKRGPLSIAVPGELRGYCDAHARHGRLKWSELFQPAIELAKNGFKIGAHLANALAEQRMHLENSTLKDEFFSNNSKNSVPLKAGETLRRPKLAATLENLAKGREFACNTFYKGDLGQEIVKEIREAGGKMKMQDLEEYKASITAAVQVKILANMTLHTVPLPGSGGVLALILNVMSQYHDMYPSAKDSLQKATLFYHRFVETLKHAYAKRMMLEDTSCDQCSKNRKQVDELFQNLTSLSYAKEIFAKIDDQKTFDVSYYGLPVAQKDDHGTAHVSIVDADGNAVAVTSTVNLYFGSQLAVSGIILNDEMDDFSLPNITSYFGLPPSPYNLIAPKKRPMSSMCPSIITNSDGKAVLVIGGAGGTHITSASALITIRNLFFGENIKVAIDAPRVHHQLLPDYIIHESNFNRHILRLLNRMGHKLYDLGKRRGSIIMAINGDKSGNLFANSDYRKGGEVDGF